MPRGHGSGAGRTRDCQPKQGNSSGIRSTAVNRFPDGAPGTRSDLQPGVGPHQDRRDASLHGSRGTQWSCGENAVKVDWRRVLSTLIASFAMRSTLSLVYKAFRDHVVAAIPVADDPPPLRPT